MNPRRIAARFGAAILTACLLAAPSHGQDALALKRRVSGEKLSFIVQGARPGEQVFLHFDVRADTEAPTPNDLRVFQFADGGGTARFVYPIEFAAVARQLYVRAFAGSADGAGLIHSNVVPLRDVAALYLLVDDPDERARVLCYDPVQRTLETRLEQVNRDSVLTVANSFPFVATRDGDLLRGDTEPTGALHFGEGLVDLIASADQSLLLALTREEVGAGRALLRLRMIEADASPREIANLEVANLEVARGGQLVSAWLVSDSNDTHRVAIAERQGAIREVVLGAEPGRGLTILPLSPLVREEMLNVRMLGDALVVVTRPGAGARRATTSRMVVFDLNDRVAPVEVALDSVANGFVLVERQGVPTAFVSLESGDVAVVPLDGGVEHPAALKIPGLRRIELGPDGGVYGLQERPAGDAVAIRIDPTSLTSTTLAIHGLSGGAAHFGVFGDARRPWLFAVQQRDPAGPYELLCAELDPVEGRVVGEAPPVVLDGRVQRVASR